MQSYEHFTLEQRESLQELKREGKSNSEIAKILGKHCSSVGRELKRNSNKDGGYHPWRATVLYIVRRKESVRKPLLSVGAAREFVVGCLEKRWSPEIISARWKMAGGKGLSHSTVYRAVKAKLLPGVSAKTHLRRRGKRKNPKRGQATRLGRPISERPEIAEKRGRLGDLEGDTVYGAIGKGVLLTLVDRRSRFLYAQRVASRDSSLVKAAFEAALEGVGVKSVTLDNGSEFAKFSEIESRLMATVYFADPHSPWQRGLNENTNGLIRFFFPKGTDFHSVSDVELQEVVGLINNRPRKCLGWLSPFEFLDSICCA